jgi:hypothetical protein
LSSLRETCPVTWLMTLDPVTSHVEALAWGLVVLFTLGLVAGILLGRK